MRSSVTCLGTDGPHLMGPSSAIPSKQIFRNQRPLPFIRQTIKGTSCLQSSSSGTHSDTSSSRSIVCRAETKSVADTVDLKFAEGLPIAEVLPSILSSISRVPNVVVEAPPGAGKTTTIPLAVLRLLSNPALPLEGKIVVLEPRRLAARNAATQMSRLLGEKVGGTVGYRTRYEKAVSSATRVEVVTEGILLRRLQRDPTLEGVAALIFDEFHERNLDSDVSLALAVDVQRQLRPELRIVCMSATLGDSLAARLSQLLGSSEGQGEAPIIRSLGRSYPIKTVYLGPPAVSKDGLELAVASAVSRALSDSPSGDLLVFLPGLREIRRVQAYLDATRSVSSNATVCRVLHGSLSPQDQDVALKPDPEGRRKIILSSPIAESSLTIPGVRIVVDAGLERRSRYDTDLGFDRLEVARISRQSADQRQGRAGREAPGSCYRLWSESSHQALPESTPPEILRVDLAPLALELCSWGGAPDGSDLPWVDPPRQDLLSGARQLLKDLGMLDARDKPTDLGKQARLLACHPRLARMTLQGAEWGQGDLACILAAMVEEKDVLRGRQTSADVGLRLEALMGGRGYDVLDRGAASRVRSAANQLRAQLARALKFKPSEADEAAEEEPAEHVGPSADADSEGAEALSSMDVAEPALVAPTSAALPMDEAAGLLLAVAFPDRIAQRRQGGGSGRDGGTNYLLAAGTGVNLRGGAQDPLSTCEYLAVASLSGESSDARNKAIYLAAPIKLAQLQALLPSIVKEERVVFWAPSSKSVQSRQRRRIGSLVLAETPVDPTPEELTAGLLEGIKAMGGLGALGISAATRSLLHRVAWVRRRDLAFSGASDLPDTSDAALEATMSTWLGPMLQLAGAKSKADLAKVDVNGALRNAWTWEQQQRVDRQAPERWQAPTGSKIPINYENEEPVIALRLQELFGQVTTPSVYDGKVPMTLSLLSPSQRPVQTTKDLPSFWSNVYPEVKKELKGRYPKHYWPDDPLEAEPVRGVLKKKPAAEGGAGSAGGSNSNAGSGGGAGKKKK